jgi:hypothetical protein
LPKLAGTLPEVRERPKVAKRPTIFAVPNPKPKLVPKSAAASVAAAHVDAKPEPKTVAKAESKPGAAPANWRSLIQLAIGILLAFLAPQILTLAIHWNPWGVRLVFPFVQLLALHDMGLSNELRRTLPQLMLFLQFPLEGLVVIGNLRRGKRFVQAAAPVVILHFMCVLVIWIVALGSQKPPM